jgi:hypothetical protein
VNFAVLRMLGARPFEEKSWRTFVSSASKENFGGALDELRNWPVGSAEQWSATANITFFAKVNMLVVNSEVFANLSEKQRDVLRRAAADTQRYVICTNSPEDKAAARICAEGVEITNSSRRDLAAFEHATQPIYSVLDKDPLTRHLIAVIRGLKHETTPTAVAACDKSKGTQERSSSRRFDPIPDGIYRLEFSTRELIAAHAVADPVAAQNAAREDAGIWTLTIRRGSWKLINKVIPM